MTQGGQNGLRSLGHARSRSHAGASYRGITCLSCLLFIGDTAASMPAGEPNGGPVSATAASHIYVSNERSGELSVIDATTHEIVATVALGKRPRGMQVSPDGSVLYVALSGSPIDEPGVDAGAAPSADKQADGIGVVDLHAHKLVRVLHGVSDPEQLVVGADGRRLYVASEDTGTTAVLDASDGRLLSTLTVGYRPEGIALSPNGRWVYVASEDEDELTVIDTYDDSVVGAIDVGARPRNVLFSPHEPVAYVACADGATIDVIDTRKHRVAGRIRIPGEDAAPMGMALSADGSTLYVATGRGGMLVAIDTATQTARAAIEIGARPWGVTISADGKRLYSANGPSNDVSVVDLDSMTVQRRIAVGQGPWTAVTQGPAQQSMSGNGDFTVKTVRADQ